LAEFTVAKGFSGLIVMLRPHSTSMKHRRGAAAVEMAIVLPLFMMIVMGIIEFGRAMMVGQLVTNAARHGSRLSIVDGSTNATVETAVKDFVASSVGVAATDVSVDITVEAGSGNPDPNDVLADAKTKDVCKVAVRVPYNRVAYIAGSFLSDAELKGECVMRHE
jgi:Flp pilus assembly protein TadG